jgi:hypothetical protein
MNQLLTSSAATKSVSFSSEIQERLINYPTAQDINATWYSEEDNENFQRVLMLDVIKCSSMMEHVGTGNGDSVETELRKYCLILSVGLDNLISRDIPQRYQAIKMARKEHARKVLDEQGRQRNWYDFHDERLACVSKASSRRSCERAHKVAKLFESIA